MDNLILVKVYGGEFIIGKWDAMKNCIIAPAAIQMVPHQKGGYAAGIAPIGWPLENKINENGFVKGDCVLYKFDSIPDGLVQQYIQMTTGIELAPKSSIISLHKE